LQRKKSRRKKRRSRKRKKNRVSKSVKSQEKFLGVAEHYFGKISVVAFKVKTAFKIGDVIHFKGSKTDFIQKIESMQMNHKDINKAVRGDEVGIKVRDNVRVGDKIYVLPKKMENKIQPGKEKKIQQPVFLLEKRAKTLTEGPKPFIRPSVPKASRETKRKLKPQAYSEIKFFSF
jgi:translation elongation factor EF-1alpha